MAKIAEIRAYMKERYGYYCHSCWIAHMKEVCGLPVKIAHNRNPQERTNSCPENKKNDLIEAFRYFKMI